MRELKDWTQLTPNKILHKYTKDKWTHKFKNLYEPKDLEFRVNSVLAKSKGFKLLFTAFSEFLSVAS